MIKNPNHEIVDDGSRYTLGFVESVEKGEYKFHARLIQNDGTRIPGLGKTKEEAVINAIEHLESMGVFIDEYMNSVKKKGLDLK